jgi:hypothetical protein
VYLAGGIILFLVGVLALFGVIHLNGEREALNIGSEQGLEGLSIQQDQVSSAKVRNKREVAIFQRG